MRPSQCICEIMYLHENSWLPGRECNGPSCWHGRFMLGLPNRSGLWSIPHKVKSERSQKSMKWKGHCIHHLVVASLITETFHINVISNLKLHNTLCPSLSLSNKFRFNFRPETTNIFGMRTNAIAQPSIEIQNFPDHIPWPDPWERFNLSIRSCSIFSNYKCPTWVRGQRSWSKYASMREDPPIMLPMQDCC